MNWEIAMKLKHTVLYLCVIVFGLCQSMANADWTFPVVQFSVGLGEKVEVQKINVLGFRAGSDYLSNAFEEDSERSNKSVIILGVVAAAAVGYAIASNDDDDKPKEEDCFIPITTNSDGTLSGTLVCR
jgi:hypothetical protein